MKTFNVFLLSFLSPILAVHCLPPRYFFISLSYFVVLIFCSVRFSLVAPFPPSLSTFYLLLTFFFLTGTGKDKGVWAAMASLQGKCEALGKIDLSFLPNIGLI